MSIINQVNKASNARIIMSSISTEKKNVVLRNIANAIKNHEKKIKDANKIDIEQAKKNKLKITLIKRLKIDNDKINEIVQNLISVATLEDPVNKVISKTKLDDDLILEKISCPIGLIGVIFESRPDALVQISSLCLKSGNCVLLKGGSESLNTNKILFKIIKDEY